MQVIRCQSEAGITYGIVDGETVQILDGDPFETITVVSKVPLHEVKLLAPCTPSKIVAFGINYAPHASEIDFDIPIEPLLFLKPSTTVIGPDDIIRLPSMSNQVEYEGELAVVIGKTAKDIDEQDALQFVFGYTCINDVTARDLQKRDVQFTRSKSFDTFAPLGPWIETDINPSNLLVKTYLNDENRQSASTSTMINSVPMLLSFVSQVMTLLPGDVIATGTPKGVGKLNSGDSVTVSIEKIGSLTNKVEAFSHTL